MIKSWSQCKNLLCIRPDNMGDLLMSSPAIRAIKTSFNCKITVLTSSAATSIASFVPEIDDVITFDLPWVKQNNIQESSSFMELVELVRKRNFDGTILFTVYSQNPLPSAMLAYLAGIPRRIAYCRENPYDLLTDWLPEKEPYDTVLHQVRRDLKLVSAIGAIPAHDAIQLRWNREIWQKVEKKLRAAGIDPEIPWLLFHPGVSEKKREFSFHTWVEAGKKIVTDCNHQVIITGTSSEQLHAERMKKGIGKQAFSLAGAFNLEELIAVVDAAPALVSVNSGPIHIAAATGTPVIVLYALTNPQHLPWKVKGKPFFFDVPEELRSKNEVVRYVHDHVMASPAEEITADEIVEAVRDVVINRVAEDMPEMMPLKNQEDRSAAVSFNTFS